jgi:hypothetical protein
MLKQVLTAASLALLLAGTASAAEDPRRGKPIPEREPAQETRQKQAGPRVLPNRAEPARPDRGEGRGDDRGQDHDRADGDHGGRDRDHRDDGRHDNDHDWRDHDHDWRDNDHDWRDNDHDWRDRDHDWRDRDWRRDDDWRRRGWVYQGGRNDGWRYYRGHDNRHWRYVPPYRYTFDFGYRSGYERAWRDWLAYGRYDRYWRRSGYGYGVSFGYSAGYEAGWRDAAFYYARGYRPDYWAYDPQGGWFFSFRIEG